MDFYNGEKVYNKYTEEELIYKWEAETKGWCWTVKINEDGEETPFGYISEEKDLVKIN